MAPIVTITFSPCVDKSTSVPALIPEKKLPCSAPVMEPGGGGINVARALRKLGGEAMAVYPAGGYTGSYLNELLALENIPSIVIETRNATRENIVVLDNATNKQYRFGMPGVMLYEREWQQCVKAIEDMPQVEFIVASGSLPPGVPPGIFATIAAIARNKKSKLIIDTSGEALRAALDEGVYMVKPNLGELASLTGTKELNEYTACAAGKNLIRNRNCELVVISMGQAGAILVSDEAAWRAIPPVVLSKSTVGAGDSMVAGLLLGLYHKKTLKETLQYGVACGTAATLNPGTALCHPGDALKLASEVSCFPLVIPQ